MTLNVKGLTHDTVQEELANDVNAFPQGVISYFENKKEAWAAKTPGEIAEIKRKKQKTWAAKTPDEIAEIKRKRQKTWAAKTAHKEVRV